MARKRRKAAIGGPTRRRRDPRVFWWWALSAALLVVMIYILVDRARGLRAQEALMGLVACSQELMVGALITFKTTIFWMTPGAALIGVFVSASMARRLRPELYSGSSGAGRRVLWGLLTALLAIIALALALYFAGSHCLRMAFRSEGVGGLPADLVATVASFLGAYIRLWWAAFPLEVILILVTSFALFALLFRLLSHRMRRRGWA